ncbi:MAG: inositol monophosphatase family protein, partial [Planctomycetota bacterium]|nr:inositol monophosphatase family protein [Planctomycetota bacterium]
HPKQGPWDIAAPQIVLEEAGGVFLNPKGQRTNLWQPEPIIVARSEQLGRQVLDLATRNVLA